MGLFNFIETFFFISLGITFVLILLLVYHFKQRLSSLEQKCDTMFEIINNVVQEITIVRGATNRIMQGFMSGPIPDLSPVSIYNTNAQVDMIQLSEAVEDEEDEDDEDDGDKDDEDEDNDEDDDNDDDDESNESGDDENDTPIENAEELIDNEEVDLEIIDEEKINNEIEQMSKEEIMMIVKNLDEEVESTPIEELIGSTLEPMEESTSDETIESTIESIESTDYKNMNLLTLKNLAVSKGLVTNASKMKKNDLLKLLEETI